MSTRACYEFEHATVYKHHDNYPSGAAHFLQNMLDWIAANNDDMCPPTGYGEAFLRANIRAELTSCAADHGDLEYIYTIYPNGRIHMAEIKYAAPRFYKTVTTCYCGTIEDFIAKYDEEME